MACKCMINSGTVAPNACLSWPNIVTKLFILAIFVTVVSPTTFKWSPRSVTLSFSSVISLYPFRHKCFYFIQAMFNNFVWLKSK